MIQLSNVSKFFENGKNAVDDISFTVNDGEIMVLLGTSGCGKTTTLRLINRLLDASSGTVEVNGENVKNIPATTLRKNIGYVLQNNGLFPHYTVKENISTVPQLLNWPEDKINARCQTLLHKLKLAPEQADSYPHQLSGGQQQRVGLARALAADPPVLLMDEPFGALDPLTRYAVRQEFKSLDELHTKTVVLVTHDIEEAFQLGDRICLMNAGRIQQAGRPADLLFHPANDFVRNFFDSQRTQLELSTLHISDIWDSIPEGYNHNGHTKITADSSCWKALSLLSAGPVIATHQDTTKEITGTAIMHGLQTYKTR
ncbi:ABC transporter ATP-binding protein [Chitinophaga sp. sic0106]|uniref:ABC transporter ATP-binding protein n=1 Tax=Chitinophaga sp. sic0106 TaxID=2854785 RepID=UPI001C46392A|nr:ATP-binding cassette domain-containing protein [Chitinophaga sp. sic0106]MBV7532579.1 ATP-binding cassette domain-containing protein [Chitinophaga sp. sic0106]